MNEEGRKKLRPFFFCGAARRYIHGVKRALVASIVLASVASALPVRAEPPADPFFGADKAKHFIASAALAGAGYGLSAIVIDGRKNRVVLGATLALGAGYSKEVLDAVGFGTPSWKDFLWDVIGTGVGVGVAVALDAAFSPSPASSSPATVSAR
jgi:putative lipoprotein